MKKHKKDSPLDLVGSVPFFILWGVGFIGPFITGVSWVSFAVAVFLYYSRMFFVTGFLHRYFSHKSFETNRFWQFIFAVCTTLAVQNGCLWWAAHHRHHHATSDTEGDYHSNFWWGFLESHVLWFLRLNTKGTDWKKVKDFSKFPELRLINNKLVYLIPPTLLAFGCYHFGEYLGARHHTNGMQMMIVGFFTSTFALHHGTFTINSISHMWGTRRYFDTEDKSLNNWFLALLVTLGEGWHNNHHRHPRRVKQGHVWYEIDITYMGLKAMEFICMIHGLRYT